MSISLQKGQKVNLSKDNVGLSKVIVGLGWDEVKQSKGFFSRKAQAIDCDASAILLKNGKLCAKEDIIYFGNLANIPVEYDKIVVVVNIYQAVQRKQHFGMIQNAFIRLVDTHNNQEMYKYNLTESYSGMTAMIFGEIYRHNGEWKFNAIGQGTNDTSIEELVRRYQ